MKEYLIFVLQIKLRNFLYLSVIWCSYLDYLYTPHSPNPPTPGIKLFIFSYRF